MPRFIELSHPLEDGMAAYPGLPRPKIGAHIDHAASRPHYDDQAEFYLGRIEMACNVGTYIDSPFHRYPGRAVLVKSGWDARWGEARYWEPGPYLGAELVGRLIEAGARLVGVDFWNVDDTSDPARPAHTRLLAADVLVLEHMCNLSSLPRDGFRFSAVPLRIVGGASFPVRAYAEIDNT